MHVTDGPDCCSPPNRSTFLIVYKDCRGFEFRTWNEGCNIISESAL